MIVMTGDVIGDWIETGHAAVRLTGATRKMAVRVFRALGAGEATDDAIDDAMVDVVSRGEDGTWTDASQASLRSSLRALRRRWIEWHTGSGVLLVEHRIRVRPDCELVVRLPDDLTAKESARVGQWVALLGVDAHRVAVSALPTIGGQA